MCIRDRDMNASAHMVERTARAGMWLSEAALWFNWKHLGELTAASAGYLLPLNASQFERIIHDYPAILFATLVYSRKFVNMFRTDPSLVSDWVEIAADDDITAAGAQKMSALNRSASLHSLMSVKSVKSASNMLTKAVGRRIRGAREFLWRCFACGSDAR